MEPHEPDPGDLSPELVLVSSPEAAQQARARLPEIAPTTDERISAMLAAGPGLPPVGEPPPPPPAPFSLPQPEHDPLPLRVAPALAVETPAPAAAAPAIEPPAPPTVPARRRSSLRIAKLAAVGGALAVAGYFAIVVWDDNASRRLGPSFIEPGTALGTATHQLGTTRAATTLPPTTLPSTTQPVKTRPSTTQPLTTQPLTTQPLTTQPSTRQPSTERVATTAPARRATHPRTQRTTTARRATTTRVTSTARTTPETTPPTGGTIAPSREFAWPPFATAVGYAVRFIREGKTVLQLNPNQARVTVPGSFVFKPGRYRWTVVPVLSRSKPMTFGPAIVDSTFLVGG